VGATLILKALYNLRLVYSLNGIDVTLNDVGYYNSNNGCVTWVCIYIETNGAQFELLICHGKDRGLFVRAIDM